MQELEKILEEIQERADMVLECRASEAYKAGADNMAHDIMRIIRKHVNGGWIPVEERLPERKVNPASQDFYEYQVKAKFGEVADVRPYKFGNGH